MSNKKSHNTIYFLTTLSVYLGLVIVGASPQVLAQAQTSETSTPHFEIRTKTNNVFSELKLKKQFEFEDVLPYTFFGNSSFTNRTCFNQTAVLIKTDTYSEIISVNNQIFTVPILPRASI